MFVVDPIFITPNIDATLEEVGRLLSITPPISEDAEHRQYTDADISNTEA